MNIPTLIDARSTPRTRAILRRLYPLYVHELAAFTSFYTLDDRGRWRPDLCADWLVNPRIQPYLIESGGAKGGLAGFAIVGHKGFRYMSPDRDHKLCEFFILSSHRRKRIGSAAATSVFELHPGSWELNVLPLNARAHAFWKSTLAAYCDFQFDEIQLPGDIAMRFESPPARRSR